MSAASPTQPQPALATAGWHCGNKSYVSVTYPWDWQMGRMVRALGTRRKAKKWAKRKADEANTLINAFGPIAARLLLDSPTISKCPAGYKVDLDVDGEFWFQVIGPDCDAAFNEYRRQRQEIAMIIAFDGLEVARAKYAPAQQVAA